MIARLSAILENMKKDVRYMILLDDIKQNIAGYKANLKEVGESL